MSSNSPKSPADSTTKPELQSIFRAVPKWQDLRFYQKSEVLYQMTYVFCDRFLPKHGDRTVDQMVQAARSGKQNIVEGSEDGKTSKAHNTLSDYEPYFQVWTAEEMANVGLTLCYQVDVMMNKYLKGVEEVFIKEGGVKERMHKARTNYRRQQDERLAELERLKPELERQLAAARAEVDKWRAAYEDLKRRALKAYNGQQEELQRLRQELQAEGQ